MSRLTTRINESAAANRKSLIAYLVAGDPERETTIKLMHSLVASGVDVIEMGVPFSDPEAEGPVIQLAHERALQGNTSLVDTLAMVAEFRVADNTTPIILMGYLNPIEKMGYEIFARAASAAGVDGTIIVNLPPEESGGLSTALEANDIDSVYLLAPTTTDERAAFVCSRSRGFVYYVSLKGTTGSLTLDIKDVRTKLARFRNISSLPVMVGFGISNAEIATQVAEVADGVVVGSAIVKLMADHCDNPAIGIQKVSDLMSGMRTGIDSIAS
ncbi:MAG: tryptophan synthase subunit alpha [Pseudomonadales bacterium]